MTISTLYAKACNNCGHVIFTPNPNISPAKVIGLASEGSILGPLKDCPNCYSGTLSAITISVP